MRRRFLILGFLTAWVLSAQTPAIQVTGDVEHPLNLTATDLAKMPHATLHTKVSGADVTFEGVWLHEILKAAGVPQGGKLRGKALAGCVLASADDGYTALFSLAELDPSFLDSQVLVADTADGKPLAGASASFRLIVPKDAPTARSVRRLAKLEVIQLRK